MKGQWIGEFSGTNTGTAILNIDDLGDHFNVVVYLHDVNEKIPKIAGLFRTKDKSKKFELETDQIFPIDPRNFLTTTWDEIKHLYPNSVIPAKAKINGEWGQDYLKIDANTSLNTNVSIEIKKKPETEMSLLKAEELNWTKFKKFVADLKDKRFIFRGQRKPWKLRTAFHRSGRYDLIRYTSEDIPALHQLLSSKTKHVFNLENPNEYGAFINLAQHHGFPTPLLDWTYSPYAAAFFAYRGVKKQLALNEKDYKFVRISYFDIDKWKKDIIQLQNINAAVLHLSVGEFLAIDNERMLPQQSVTTFSNIDDIESYVQYQEQQNGNNYLKAIDLPLSERNKVLRELAFMGITAGSMFPGLDGACEELKERLF